MMTDFSPEGVDRVAEEVVVSSPTQEPTQGPAQVSAQEPTQRPAQVSAQEPTQGPAQVSAQESKRRIGLVLAKAIRLLFHPLTMGVWIAVLVMCGYASQLRFPAALRQFVVSNVAVITIVIPLIFNLLLHLFGVIRRDDSKGRKVTIMRLAIAALCFVCCAVMFTKVPLLFLVRKMLFLGAIVLVVALIMEFIRPICHHTLAYGALLGYMWVLLYVGNMGMLYPFILALVCGGLLITACLYLTDFSPRLIYWPLVVGFVIAFMGSVLV